MRYFKVTAKCGHVGRGYYIPIDFAIVAKDGKQAASITRDKPRVKHDHKDAILSVTEITFEEFMVLRSQNDADPFLHCKNIQQQRGIEGLSERLVPEIMKEQVKNRATEYRRKKYKIIERSAIKAVADWC